ncbi:uncharacterized protein LOC108849538 [Raphanus sativus]|uniref:Uncharacterized protein LOC108849538 n=1 Tax=Raphanus sativus TaxID=3726 RepID=A0A6J0N1N1_RAPSA|nr:uncharacterized protein LOC108849538 [Raphanus sativus]
MEDDDVDDLWGPPLVVKDDTFGKQLPLRGCEFWFDFRTDVLEESFQIGRYCELVWTILNEKKIDELGSPPDSDKTLSATLPDADTSSAKSSLDEDENTSSISDAQTMQNKDSTNETEEVDPETNLKPQEETAEANEEITVEVVEDVDTSLSPVLGNNIEEAEEHSCSSLVTQQVFDPIKQAPENKSPSAIISQENNGEGSTLTPLVETKEKANATNEDGEILKDQQKQKQSDSLQDIETASEPFTTESLLEMCDDEPEKGREEEAPSERSMTEAVKTVVVKEEPIINMLTEARIKIESKEASLNPPVSVPIKKRKRASDCTSLIRNTKQKVVGGEVNTTPTESKPKIIITKGPSVPPPLSASTLDLIDRIRQRRGWKTIMGEPPVILLSELHDKTGKELRSIAKELKITHYYKMKKEDLLQNCIMWLKLQLTGCCKEQRMESQPLSLV